MMVTDPFLQMWEGMGSIHDTMEAYADHPCITEDLVLTGKKMGEDLLEWNKSLDGPHDVCWLSKKAYSEWRRITDIGFNALNEALGIEGDYRG